jgi:hypothetical protein
MAGQARRGTHGQARSSRADSAWPVLVGASEAGSGSATATTTAASTPASTAELTTRSTYRNLIIRGLAPDEAAKLTAWMAGINVGDSSWTLRQINQLLFLRQMNRNGHFAEAAAH